MRDQAVGPAGKHLESARLSLTCNASAVGPAMLCPTLLEDPMSSSCIETLIESAELETYKFEHLSKRYTVSYIIVQFS